MRKPPAAGSGPTLKVQYFWDGYEGTTYVGPPWQGKGRIDLRDVTTVRDLAVQVCRKADSMFGEGALPFDRVELSYKLRRSQRSSGHDDGIKGLLPLESLSEALAAGIIFVTRGESNGHHEQPRLTASQPDSSPLEFVLQWGTRPDVLFHAQRRDIPTVDAARALAAEKASLLTGEQLPPSAVRLMALQHNPVTNRLQLLPVTQFEQLQQASAVQVTQAQRGGDDDPFV